MRRRKAEPPPPIKTVVKLETVENNELGAGLFETMLRSVEMEKEQASNDRANTPVQCSRTRKSKHK